MPLILTTLALLAAGVVGWFARGWREALRPTPYVPPAGAVQAAEERGFADGIAYGRRDMVFIAELALGEFPTSLGGRAIVRALGGTVPKLPRTKKGEPSATIPTDSEGAED